MKYFAQLTNNEQLMLLERLVKVLKKDLGEHETIYDAVEAAINSKVDDLEDVLEIRICTECEALMVEGYCIDGGSEYYCSDTCLHEHYSREEYDAMCAGLDPTDEEELETLRSSTEEELEEMRGGSDTYFTSWEK
ncbi:hypothetical protein [Sphaerochaeta globosa]|uniref:Uncharacterized protein n=1 Tax=Sphaerochaeta globosa (strain ATCC BAA-1886 / DSM 22777 / Buddy) TaxID=158189 RepID=F0RWN7_SPHGB|nr:hypothetical protein [Sphaerochaeta globosa]ADY13668.1 hypothetical protein SpiBuddy_1844 [Sphaerochaeta globosa str. Buddy]